VFGDFDHHRVAAVPALTTRHDRRSRRHLTTLLSPCTGSYPSLTLDATGGPVVSQAGATLLIDTVRTTGLEQALSSALAR
jgi:hypothetical protein